MYPVKWKELQSRWWMYGPQWVRARPVFVHKVDCLIPGLGEEAPSLAHVSWVVLATGLATHINCTTMNK